nr:CoA ester lyase [uncultured Gellertiella sp.]
MRFNPAPEPLRLRRSALSIPAINPRALEKSASLDADVLIFDLEDSVTEDRKSEARDNLKRHFGQATPSHHERLIRINAVETPHLDADLETVLACRPDGVLLPKVEGPRAIFDVADRLAERDAPTGLKIWAMIETPKAVLNAALIAEAAHTPGARLAAFVIGLNDLRKQTGVPDEPGRTCLLPWMMQILLAARAYGLDILDSVSNQFRDLALFEAECRAGRGMGFDGKMLIHPAQVEPANRHFGPAPEALDRARRIIAAFDDPATEGVGVVDLDGQMVERLHLDEARRLMDLADTINARKVAP